MFFHAEVEMPYMFLYDFNNNEYRPQVSPKNPKSWGQPQTKSRQFITNQRLVNLRVAEREARLPMGEKYRIKSKMPIIIVIENIKSL